MARTDKKAIVFGNAGQLGVELMREFAERGFEVRGTDRSEVDITDAAAVERAICDFDPAVVVNAAAYNMVDVAEQEPQAAYIVNGLAVRNLALACRQTDAKLVHFSTDYVFDGVTDRPYAETDMPHPLSAYGVSKLVGELYAQAYCSDALVVRTCGVFGPGGRFTNRGNFVELMLRLGASSNPIRVVEDHVASPTYAPALAARTTDLIEKRASGLFHIGGGVPISWFAYAKRIFDLAGLKPQLRATNEREYRTAARRPKYSALSNAKAEQFGIAPMPRFDDCIQDYLKQTNRLNPLPAAAR
jgi:dTDP-4-dehydrorhamnose reductase